MWRLDKVVRAIVSGDGSHGAASSVAQAAMMSPSVDRLLQEFLLGGESLSPPCAGQDEQVGYTKRYIMSETRVRVRMVP